MTDCGAIAVLDPVGPQREGCNGLGGVKRGQVSACTPEPRKELERAFLGANGGERDALVAGGDNLLDRRGERRVVGDGRDVDARIREHRGVVVEAERVGANGHAVDVLPSITPALRMFSRDVGDVETVRVGCR